MRLIDADALMERMYHNAFETDTDMQKWDSGCWIRYKMFENAMNSAPTVDAVEVVRCKDCKYSKHLKQYPKVNTWKCTLTDVVYRADDYCSYGERKENNETDRCG